MFWKTIAMVAAVTAAVVTGPLMAQELSAGSPPIPAPSPDPYNQARAALDQHFWQNDASRRNLEPSYRVYHVRHHGPKDLPAVREHLAEAWQHVGMSPAHARAVAATYDYAQDDLAGLPSIRGKTNREIAQMMQEALAGRQYVVANHLLISYERQRLNLPAERLVSHR